MSKEDLGKLIDSKKFSKTMYCYGDDKLGNFIKEIYFDGMRGGYNLAKFRLELLDGMPFDAADEYWDNNMEKIRNILNLCKQYDEIDKQKMIDTICNTTYNVNRRYNKCQNGIN